MANTLDFTTEKGFPCQDCNRVFYVQKNYRRHMVIHKSKLKCTYCSKLIERAANLQFHERTCEKNPLQSTSSSVGGGVVSAASAVATATATAPTHDDFRLVRSSFGGVHVLYQKVFARNTICWNEVKRSLLGLKPILEKERLAKQCIKWSVSLKVIFMKAVEPEVVTDPPAYFRTECLRGFVCTRFDRELELTFDALVTQVDEFTQRGSGWVIKNFVALLADIYTYMPLLAYASDNDNDAADDDHDDI
jgi:hypothetical protein